MNSVESWEQNERRYVIELEPGVWYDGGGIGWPPETMVRAYATSHTKEFAVGALARARRLRPCENAKLVEVEE